MTRKLPLNYATLTNFLVVGKIHFVIDLMDLAIDPTDINDVKVFHDRFLNLFYHEEDRLLMIVLQRIWKIAGFNINEEVDCSGLLTIPTMSLFKLFLNLGKYDLLTRLIKLFPDELRVTESDKDYAVSRSSEGKEQKLFSDYAVDNYNKQL
jgi:hypothetical protein